MFSPLEGNLVLYMWVTMKQWLCVTSTC